MNRIPSLDGLRAFSIGLVIIGHLWLWPNGVGRLLAIFGVHVFFVISGYLITGLLQKEQQRDGRISLTAFYRRRSFRIFPAACFYILMIALFYPSARFALPYALTYTVSYNFWGVPSVLRHLWSLSVEEQFYLLWPLALVLGFRFRAYIAWAAILFSAAFRLSVASGPAMSALALIHFSFPATMDSIAVGCLLAMYEPAMRARLGSSAESTTIVVALPITAWVVSAVCWNGRMSAFFGIVPLLIGLWVFLLIERRDWILNNSVASAIGILSYSIYLWQQPFTDAPGSSALKAILLVPLCALVSYFLVERPMLNLGKRWPRFGYRLKVFIWALPRKSSATRESR